MKTIVVGTDGSSGAAHAVRWANRLAWAHGAEVVVMTGYTPTQSELPPGHAEGLLDQERQRLEQWSERLRLGDVPLRTVVVEGDPRPGILSVAEEVAADLVVVGRVGSSAGPGPLHIGSMAEWLAHHTDRPLAVIGGRVSSTTRSVLVGVDGSEGSDAALRWVAGLASSAELRVVAATVEEPLVEWTPASSPLNWRRGVEEQVRTELAADLTAAGIDFTALALAGMNVPDVLLQAASEERIDVIVLGMRGLGGFTGLRIGGVALKVLHRVDRPIVLVPTP